MSILLIFKSPISITVIAGKSIFESVIMIAKEKRNKDNKNKNKIRKQKPKDKRKLDKKYVVVKVEIITL